MMNDATYGEDEDDEERRLVEAVGKNRQKFKDDARGKRRFEDEWSRREYWPQFCLLG